MPIEKDFRVITDLAVCICGCGNSLICIFDHELRLQTGISGSEGLTNLLLETALLPGEITLIDINLLGNEMLNEVFTTSSQPRHSFFLAAIPLITDEGEHIGALCLTDQKTIEPDHLQQKALILLANQLVSMLIDTMRSNLQQQSLAKAEQFYHLFDQSSEIHCITDLQGRIAYINNSVFRLLGYTPEEAMGKTIWDFCVPGERERLRPEIYAELGKGADRFCVETRTLTKASELRWFEWSDVVKQDHWLINGRDITDRKQAELNARILGTAVERSSSAIFIRNPALEITWVNPAAEQLMGFSLEELQGKPFGDLFVGPETDLGMSRYAAAVLQEHRPYEIEVQLYRKDKRPVWLFISTSFVLDPIGEVERVVSVAFEITARKKYEAQTLHTRDEAVRLSRAKESFLSVMSHEMRTPLNAVIGISRILSEEEHPAHQQEHLDILSFSAQNLLTLINDILDFTKIETGNMVLESRPVDLELLLRNAVQSLKPKANEQGIGLFYEISPRMPVQVQADQTRLYQILMNLIGNAVKFTSSGYVKVSLQLLGQSEHELKIGFAVSDTGIGIAPDKLDSIFDAYTQAGSDITRKYGGTGLGLAITKKLIDLYLSNIEVASEIGKGTTFSFAITFPKANSTENEDLSQQNQTALKGHVLVVDDSSVNRLVAGKVLSKWGLTTDFAENGVEALEKIRLNRYSLVLMDIHMPLMNGLEATKQVRAAKNAHYQFLPILALTGSISNNEQQMIESFGMNGYILKPFDTDGLYRKIKPLLD